MLKILCKKSQNLFQDFGGSFLKIKGDSESRKLIILELDPNITCVFEFSFKYKCSVSQHINIVHGQLNLFTVV